MKERECTHNEEELDTKASPAEIDPESTMKIRNAKTNMTTHNSKNRQSAEGVNEGEMADSHLPIRWLDVRL